MDLNHRSTDYETVEIDQTSLPRNIFQMFQTRFCFAESNLTNIIHKIILRSESLQETLYLQRAYIFMSGYSVNSRCPCPSYIWNWILRLSIDLYLSYFHQFPDLYTPELNQVRKMRVTLSCHNFYIVVYIPFQTKKSCRIKKVPPLALSLLWIIIYHLARSWWQYISIA